MLMESQRIRGVQPAPTDQETRYGVNTDSSNGRKKIDITAGVGSSARKPSSYKQATVSPVPRGKPWSVPDRTKLLTIGILSSPLSTDALK